MAEKKEKKKSTKKRCFDYPAETEGSRLAAEARARTNNLPQEKLDELYELAKRLAYGSDKSKVGARH